MNIQHPTQIAPRFGDEHPGPPPLDQIALNLIRQTSHTSKPTKKHAPKTLPGMIARGLRALASKLEKTEGDKQ